MKRTFNETTWPKRNAKLEAALGRCMIAWNILEQEVNFAIQEICRLDFHEGASVTANLGTKAKLDIFQSLAFGFQHAVDEGFTATVDKLVGETGNASGELRNFLFHGQPIPVAMSATSKRTIQFWGKISARKGGVRGSMERLSPESVQKRTDHIASLIERWTAVRRQIATGVEFLDFLDRESKTDEHRGMQFEITPKRR